MTAPVVQLFVNPRPRWRARRRITAVHRAFERAGATVLVTRSASGRLEIDLRADHLCAVGGDGTLRHVVDALHRSGRAIPVSAYPAGTINLLARESGYPRAPEAFVRRVLDGGALASHYTALVGDEPLLTCASVGPDSFVVDMLSPPLKARIGRAAYVVAFCKLLVHWPRVGMTLSSGGRRVECEAVYIAKGRFFAGPWSFAPQARATDPVLHVVSLQRAARRDFVRFGWALLRGCPVDTLDGVQSFRCTELAISSKTSAPLQADGDIVAHLPATISLRAEPTRFA